MGYGIQIFDGGNLVEGNFTDIDGDPIVYKVSQCEGHLDHFKVDISLTYRDHWFDVRCESHQSENLVKFPKLLMLRPGESESGDASPGLRLCSIAHLTDHVVTRNLGGIVFDCVEHIIRMKLHSMNVERVMPESYVFRQGRLFGPGLP